VFCSNIALVEALSRDARGIAWSGKSVKFRIRDILRRGAFLQLSEPSEPGRHRAQVAADGGS
jgi:hypothetical protein